MKILVIDPKIAGISGDMLLASLIDLTGSFDVVEQLEDEINKLENCKRFKVEVKDEDVGISAKKLEIEIDESRLKHPKGLKKAVNSVVKNLDLSQKAVNVVNRVVDDLINVEAKLHKTNFHLHEIASLDTIFDVVGSVMVLDKNNFLEADIYSTPPVLGNGYIEMEHGKIACPAPATLEILSKHRFKYSNLPVNMELTTPTGVALLVNIVSSIVDFFPPMTPVKVGYGTGTKKVDGLINVLRVVEGEEFRAVSDKIVILETNVDDVSGEIIGYTINKLLNEGAVDVFVTQAIGKKNRPVNVISVITDYKNYERMVELLMNETGTIGVRIYELPRLVAERVKKKIEVEIQGKKYQVTIKISKVGRKIVNVKPEYEDLKRIAEDLRMPLRVVSKIVEEAIKD
ncbi:nickel pincer cofactor biosynthesis protein LarC [Archaeoglobales archaeon]|mgnify:CR=1 FL=1|nr:MAG: nickel pincer cofactor biosynthesis protein LarC [Archaeoglobales archaeon]